MTQHPSSSSEDSLAKVEHQKVGFDTGALLPRDMTVRLVRADSAGWEIFLSALYSLVLAVFGVFLGAWITDAQSQTPRFTFFDKFACVIIGCIALVLAGAWVCLKIKQGRATLRVPLDLLKAFDEDRRGT
jgi:hypothetical protein